MKTLKRLIKNVNRGDILPSLICISITSSSFIEQHFKNQNKINYDKHVYINFIIKQMKINHVLKKYFKHHYNLKIINYKLID